MCTREQAAIHEASHCVVAHALGVNVIETRVAARGTTLLTPEGKFWRGYCTHAQVPDDVAITVSGLAGERLDGRFDEEDGGAGDIAFLQASGIGAEEIRTATRQATEILIENAAAVKTLAEMLLERGTILGAESLAVYERLRPTLEQRIVKCVGDAVREAFAALPRRASVRRTRDFKTVSPTALL